MLNTANTQPVTTAAPESTWSPIAINQEEPRMATAATTATTVTTTTAATPLLATSSNPVADESEEPGDRTALLLDSSTPS